MMRIPDGELRRLNLFFFALLEDVLNEYDVPPGAILNRLRRSHGVRHGDVGGARHAMAATMRAYVQQWYLGDGPRFRYHPDGLPDGAAPISYPNVADWIGVDHSTFVHGAKVPGRGRVLPFPIKFVDGAAQVFSDSA